MDIRFVFRTSSPVLDNKTTFAGMSISNYKSNYIEVVDRYVEECDIAVNTEYHTPTLISTLSELMKYWREFEMVESVSELQTLIVSALCKYTTNDFGKCIEWDDFEDFIILLLITLEYIKSNRITEDDLIYFNTEED